MTPTQTADVPSILPGLAQGDRVAVSAAYGMFGGPVTTIAFGVLGDGDLAGRAVLSTFYRIAESTLKLLGGVDPNMLVYSLARSEITNLWQAETERRRAPGEPEPSESLGAIALDSMGSAWDVRRAIDQLGDDEQTLLKLVHFGSMQPSAIIEYLNISVDELKSLSRRAHRELASILSQIESGEDHSLDHVTSLLCSDAMWTATTEPMVDSIMTVIAAGPSAMEPTETEVATETEIATQADAEIATQAETEIATGADQVSVDAANAGSSTSSTTDAGAVHLRPVGGAGPSTRQPADTVINVAADPAPSPDSARPALDLPWKTAETPSSLAPETSPERNGTFSTAAAGTMRSGPSANRATPPVSQGNGSGATVDPLRPKDGPSLRTGSDPSTEAGPTARITALRPNDDIARTDSAPAATAALVGDAPPTQRAHLPLPDPVSAPVAVVGDVPPQDAEDGSRLPARIPGTYLDPSKEEKSGLRFKMSGSSLLAIGAILLGLVIGIATIINMRSEPVIVGTQVVFPINGTEILPTGSALVTLSEAPAGVEVYLEFDQVGAAPEGTFFQGWAQTTSGVQIPLGTFHLRREQTSGREYVALWAGVDLEELTEITVRLQRVGGPNEPSSEVLLAGAVVFGAG